MAFLFIYLLRMVYDQGKFIRGGDDLIFYIIATLIPLLSVSLLNSLWDDRKMAVSMALGGGVACLFMIAASVFGFSSWRSTTENSGGRFSYDVLDSIGVANVGAMTAIAGFVWANRRLAILPVLILTLGIVVVALGLSRGPIISMAMAAAGYLWITRRYKTLAAVMLSTVPLIFSDLFQPILETLRLDDIGGDDSSLARLIVLQWSIAGILESPVLGVSYLEPITANYPHNLFVEAGLAMGLGGIALAIIICGYAMRAAVARGHRGELFLFLTFIYWLVEAQFSGAVWSNVMLWLSVAILIPTRISSGQNPLGVRGLNDLELYRDDWRKRNSAATQVFSNKERGVRK